METLITNDEFERLLKLNKHFEVLNIKLPIAGERSKPFKVLSDSTRDIFLLDIDRKSSITLTRKKLQNRHSNTNTMMIRVEIDCRPHMYGDGRLSSRNHIHIFDEKLGNKVYDLDKGYDKFFKNTSDFSLIFSDFCKMCNINIDSILIQGVI